MTKFSNFRMRLLCVVGRLYTQPASREVVKTQNHDAKTRGVKLTRPVCCASTLCFEKKAWCYLMASQNYSPPWRTHPETRPYLGAEKNRWFPLIRPYLSPYFWGGYVRGREVDQPWFPPASLPFSCGICGRDRNDFTPMEQFFLGDSRVVSTHLWNTPLNLSQQAVKGILS